MKYIYKLTDPLTGEVRFIGTSNEKRDRYSSQLLKESTNDQASVWLDGLKLAGTSPKYEMLEEVTDEKTIQREQAWIKKHESKLLLNVSGSRAYANANSKGYQLTSIKINPDLYKEFKIKRIDFEFTLQELVNRAIYMYNNDCFGEAYETLTGSTL